jgi:hypothetical protein
MPVCTHRSAGVYLRDAERDTRGRVYPFLIGTLFLRPIPETHEEVIGSVKYQIAIKKILGDRHGAG